MRFLLLTLDITYLSTRDLYCIILMFKKSAYVKKMIGIIPICVGDCMGLISWTIIEVSNPLPPHYYELSMMILK